MCRVRQANRPEGKKSVTTKRVGTYRKKVRDDIAKGGNALSILGKSAKENLERLKEVGVGLISG